MTRRQIQGIGQETFSITDSLFDGSNKLITDCGYPLKRYLLETDTVYEDLGFSNLVTEAREESQKDDSTQALTDSGLVRNLDAPGDSGLFVRSTGIGNRYGSCMRTKPCESLVDISKDLRILLETWYGLDFSRHAAETR